MEQVEVDACVITEGPRCDWLVRVDDAISKEEVYVELKGSDLRHAVAQLEATIDRLCAGGGRLRKRCYVVFSRNPLTGTDVQRYKARFHRRFGAVFNLERDRAEVPL